MAIARRLALKQAARSEPARDYSRYQSDPVAFVREVLGAEPWSKQEAIISALADHPKVTVRSCNNAGKTFIAAAAAHWFARCFSPSLVLTTAPTERQVKEVLWYEIARMQRAAGLSGSLSTMALEVGPNQRALGMTTNTPERFQGWHCPAILIIVDEASGVSPQIYEAIEGCLTTNHARLLMIGNPNYPSGMFYESFRSPIYKQFHINAFEVPSRILSPGWAEEKRLQWGEDSPTYAVRVLGEFPDQSEDALISMRWVTEAQERNLASPEADAAREPVEMGVDIARYGSDESVAYVRRGGRVIDSAFWRGADTMSSAGRVAALARQHSVSLIKVDDIGVGGGVVDRLKEEKFPVWGVNVGEAAFDSESYFNRRTELFVGLRDRFRDGDIDIPEGDTLLLDQLVSLRFGYTPRGQMKLMSKEDVRKERMTSSSWKSPDRADALMLSMATCGPRWLPYSAVGEEREQ